MKPRREFIVVFGLGYIGILAFTWLAAISAFEHTYHYMPTRSETWSVYWPGALVLSAVYWFYILFLTVIEPRISRWLQRRRAAKLTSPPGANHRG